jgi:hypothetical protein
MSDMIDLDPNMAKLIIGKTGAAMAGGDKWIASMAALNTDARAQAEAPADLAKKNADADKARAEATVAQGTIAPLIQKPVEDNLTAQNKRRLADFDAQIAAADSETKRGELVLARDKFALESGLKQQEAGQGAQAQIDSAQMALDNIKSLRAHPILKDTAGNSIAGIGTMLGQMMGNVPGTENKDFRGQLESLKSQVFLPAVQQVKGMGSLSNAEGEKLTASVAALDANMSPAAFKNALGVVEKYMTKGLQKGLASKTVPTTGGGFVMTHPTYGKVTEGDINRLMKQYPNSSRDAIVQWLQQSGGK